MYFGADYYPEHVAESIWPEDARLMREAGMNIARLAEFAWSVLEPEPDVYNFGWLDRAISVLTAEGIGIVLGTPTATPPKWLVDKYPGILPADRYGNTKGCGSRRHYCCNSPEYRELSKRIVSRLAERYGNRPELIAWQIDNEFGGHDTTRCYCTECLRQFRQWLERRYGSIDELNRQWGTVFWSQRYSSFDEVSLPTYTVCDVTDQTGHGLNPSQVLDFQRFSSDSVADYQQIQIDELRRHSGKPVTHNFMGHFPDLDYFKLAGPLDFVAWDNYPNSQWGGNPMNVSMAHDLMRGLKGRKFWVMEQQSGPCGWSTLGGTPKPGQLRLYTWQAVAHGAEAVLYFPWRACPVGAEQYWYGVLDHDSVPRRRYYEIKHTIREIRCFSPTLSRSSVTANIALIKSYDNLWSHRNQPHSTGFDYGRLLEEYYTAALSSGYTLDVISIDADLSPYKAVLAPALNLTTQEIVSKLDRYARQGGTLLITFRSGTREWNNTMSRQTIPGPFAEMAGIEAEEFESLGSDRIVDVGGSGFTGAATTWCDIIKPKTAEPVLTYRSDFYAGKPAVTMNRHGAGTVIYVGCELDPQCLKRLLESVLTAGGAHPVLRGLPEGVEAIAAEHGGDRIVTVLNHNGFPVAITLQGFTVDLLTGNKLEGMLELGPYGVAVLDGC